VQRSGWDQAWCTFPAAPRQGLATGAGLAWPGLGSAPHRQNWETAWWWVEEDICGKGCEKLDLSTCSGDSLSGLAVVLRLTLGPTKPRKHHSDPIPSQGLHSQLDPGPVEASEDG